jgi:ABC-type multidrug transport system ATPase subunit
MVTHNPELAEEYSNRIIRLLDGNVTSDSNPYSEAEEAAERKEEKKVTKAKLAKAVEDAEKDLDEAYAGLEEAKKQVAELQKEYDDKVDAIMNPARDLIKECTKARADAIKQFNDNFGVYTTTYTGNKALNELAKAEEMFNKFWKRFYW